MTETLQGLKAIVDGAPDECTHHRPETEYGYDNLGFKLRALSDIKARIALMEEVERLRGKITSALHTVANQYEGDDSTDWSIGANHVFKLFAKQLLEQSK